MQRSTFLVSAMLMTALVAGALPGPAAAQTATASFLFEAQNSGGHAVVVRDVHVPEGGFVTIHDATLLSKGDPLGSVIGVSDYLAPGDYPKLRVFLTRALTGSNETLIAMPHKDTNGNHIYDFASSNGADDGPYTGGPQALSGLSGSLAGFNGISAVARQINNTAVVDASDQSQSGKSVIIDFVDLSQDGYVAVHDATLVQNPGPSGVNGNNLFSSVVGVSDLLTAGVHRDVVVDIGNNCGGCTIHSNVTGTLIPMAHKETNGNSAYDFITSKGASDGPFTGQPGTPLTTVISVISVTYADGAWVDFPSQATGGHILLVPAVFLPEGGFVAIHDGTLVSRGDPLGSVRGVSAYLSPGLHRNVTVELSTDATGAKNGAISESDTLFAMPHKDTNGNKQYDFVRSSGADDGPYTGGPQALTGLSGSLAGFNGISTAAAVTNVSSSVRLAANQFSQDGKAVKLEYADFSQAGFVALHDGSLLANVGANVFSSVVGVSRAYAPGLYRDQVVPIGDANCRGCVKLHPLNTSQTIVAMPHKDTDGNGLYDFIVSNGADDGPFLGGGSNGNTATPNHIVVGVGGVTTPIVPRAADTSPAPTPSPTPSPTPGSSPAAPSSTPGISTAVTLASLVGLALLAAGWRRRRA